MDRVSHDQQLARMLTSHWITQGLYAAAKLGLPDLLATGPKNVSELAAVTSTNPDALFRLLRALSSIGVFEEGEPKVFTLTPLAELLRSDVPGSQRALALMLGEEQHKSWGEILYSLQTGKPAFDEVYGKPIFDYLSEHPEKAKIFDAAMTGIHGPETGAMLAAYDFSSIHVIADVGGGNGTTLCAILKKYPAMRGILFDLPHVVERAKSTFEAAGISDRCKCVGGSFFESIPSGADAYLMRHIIHDWNDEQSLTILKNCHAAMSAGAKLLLVEGVIPPGNDPSATKLLDLTMLVIPGGKERTEDEYRSLYRESGFELARVVPTSWEVSVIEGVRL